jgi:glycosyltransferase involved in cell wall biosynthesis
VTFAGRVNPGDIHAYYADADIYIQTPAIDNMPSSILEAFAMGLPVVSTDAGGVPAMLTDGVHGLLAPVGDAGRIAAHVLALLDDPKRAREMVAAAYESTDRLRWSRVRDSWLELYRGVLDPVAVGAQARPV